jgi:broad specificity phosphatase PhoE
MGTAYLLRHGETEYHARKRLLGRLDISLNDRGREQARRVAEHFDGLKFAAVYSSPLKRCMETGEPTARAQGIEMVVMDGLMEVDMGKWDGQLIEELLSGEDAEVGRWMSNPSSVTIPGGEDFGAVRRRVMSAMGEITARHQGDERVLVVTHGGPIRGIICEALRMDLDNMFRLQIDLASISIVRFYEGGIADTSTVTLLNKTSHLD